MSNKTNATRVFISYSWSPVQNQNWVIELAERLVSDGIDVTIDVWDFEEGQNKYSFMERMVNDEEIKKVLVICNKEYAEKADAKSGGVGNESMIISPEIYSNVNQTKFIPLIRDFKDDDKPCVPVFIKGAKYLDFSSKEKFEEEYEKLLRNILGKPSRKKPPLGNIPSHLANEETLYLRTSRKAERIKDSLINNNPMQNRSCWIILILLCRH